jgi:hypothetical protein
MTPPENRDHCFPVRLWVWLCAGLNCAGWGLSAVGQLNVAGYLTVLLAGAGLLAVWSLRAHPPGTFRFFPRLPHRRFRRWFPLAFLLCTALSLLGGAIWAPDNYDGLSYRLPRILHWLAAGQWHWIHTIFPRVNARACGVEWVSAPLLALTRTDRLLFLINIVSFLLLPGLIYSLFTRLGVRRRAAWHWMWLVPTGYGLLLQAGSVGNDLFGVPFVLAAVDFALRARTSGSARDLFTSILAAALITSAKSSSLPLLLPWALALLPSWRLVFRWPLRLAAVAVLAVFASFLPTAILNAHFCHDWSGVKSEGTPIVNDPPLRLANNLVLVAEQNLTPPVFPWAGQWNEAVKRAIPAGLEQRLLQAYTEPDAATYKTEFMQMEEGAGLGLGVTLLVCASLAAALRQTGRAAFRWDFGSREAGWLTLLRWSPVVALLVLLSQSALFAIARILTPYYALLLPAVLAGLAQERLVRQTWWRAAAAVVFLLALLLVVITPPRPLFPVKSVLSVFPVDTAAPAVIQKARRVYNVYQSRNEAFAPVLSRLPPDLKILGLFTYDDPETSLWRPFGSRRIEHVCPEDTAADLHRRGIEYVLIPRLKLEQMFHCPAEAWVHRVGGTVVDVIPLDIRAGSGPQEWWLVRLTTAPAPAAP